MQNFSQPKNKLSCTDLLLLSGGGSEVEADCGDVDA